jgi:hypothetical protein
MNMTDFEGMCELSNDGQLIWVENDLTRMKGRVVGYGGDRLEVQVGEHQETWNHCDCTEMTHGYKVRYDRVKMYPHEFDTHMD